MDKYVMSMLVLVGAIIALGIIGINSGDKESTRRMEYVKYCNERGGEVVLKYDLMQCIGMRPPNGS